MHLFPIPHKVMLYSNLSSKAYNQEDINKYWAGVQANKYMGEMEKAEVVELYFADDWCYRFKNKFGPTGLYNQFGIWVGEHMLVIK